MWGLRRRTRLKRERLRTYKAQNLRFGSNIEAIKNEITEVEQIFCLTSVIFFAFPASSSDIYRSRAGFGLCFGITILLFLLPHLPFTEVEQVLRFASVSLTCFSCSLTCLLPKYSRFWTLLRYYYLAFPASSPIFYRSRAGFALCFGNSILSFMLPRLSITEVKQVPRSASVSLTCFSCSLTCLLPKYSRFRALLR